MVHTIFALFHVSITRFSRFKTHFLMLAHVAALISSKLNLSESLDLGPTFTPSHAKSVSNSNLFT